MAALAVLFDLDGTLIDSLPDIAGVVNKIRVLHDLPPLADASIGAFVGKGVEYLMENTLEDVAEEMPMSELVGLYRKHYGEFEFVGHLYPGVRETLESLRRHPDVRLGVVTNRLTDLAVKSVEHYLPGFEFDRIAGPDSVSRYKPYPEHIWEVLDTLQVTPDHAWFVGDHNVDRECALRAGVSFLGAGYGLSGVQVPNSQQLKQFGDLLNHLPNVISEC
ncbi:MAG: HAD hydrolase-like protein [Bdellovibrionales bacterium]|nr:HAD hydrolase-like protein [Bdellovibrionales bacterium]